MFDLLLDMTEDSGRFDGRRLVLCLGQGPCFRCEQSSKAAFLRIASQFRGQELTVVVYCSDCLALLLHKLKGI